MITNTLFQNQHQQSKTPLNRQRYPLCLSHEKVSAPLPFKLNSSTIIAQRSTNFTPQALTTRCADRDLQSAALSPPATGSTWVPYVYKQVQVWVCAYVCMKKNVQVWVCAYVCMKKNVQVWVCAYVCMKKNVQVWVCANVCMCKHVQAFVHMFL